jgi:integrase
VANKVATLYIATKLASGRWTVKSLPRKPVDLQPPSYFRLFWYAKKKKLSKNVGRSWDDARAAQVHIEEELKRVAIGEEPEPEEAHAGLELAEALSDYLSRVKKARKHKTYLGYNRTLQDFAAVVGNRCINALTRRDILKFMDWMRDRGMEDRTIHNRLTALKTFFIEYSLAWPMLKNDRVKYTEPLVRAYSEEDLRRLYSVTDEEETDLFQFFLVTGGREQEVGTATWTDLDFDRHEFLIQDKRDLDWSSKDREEGGIPIPEDFIERMQTRRRRYPDSRFIFGNALGKPQGHFLRQLQRLAKREGLNCGGCVNRKGESCSCNAMCSSWGLHRFRKTFASLHHDNGVPVRTIQRWLRHSSLDTTLRYLEAGENKKYRAKVNTTFTHVLRAPQ